MTISLTIEGPFQKKPGRFKSRVVTRYWWGWFAIKRIHVSEYDYATKEWAWNE